MLRRLHQMKSAASLGKVVKLVEEEQGKELVEAQALITVLESVVVETLVMKYPPPPSQTPVSLLDNINGG